VLRVEQQPAYVLHERPYRETSLLVELFTRDHGRIGVVARGVRSAKPRLSRGVLRPLQALAVSYTMRGELGTMTDAEPTAVPLAPGEQGLACALYVNELTLRLLPRQDPHADVFDRYAACIAALANEDAMTLAWALRRYERDLVAAIGYALALDACADSGLPIEPDRLYRYDPEAGVLAAGVGEGGIAVSGAALIALRDDAMPEAEPLRELRRLMRQVLRHQLGGRELASWRLLGATRVRPDAPAGGRTRG
jgi:DNA repair protein RecO (recombination protein O)